MVCGCETNFTKSNKNRISSLRSCTLSRKRPKQETQIERNAPQIIAASLRLPLASSPSYNTTLGGYRIKRAAENEGERN